MQQYNFKKVYRKRWIYRFTIIIILFTIATVLAFKGLDEYHSNQDDPFIVSNDAEYSVAVENDSYIKIYANEIHDLGIEITRTKKTLGIETDKNVESRFVAVPIEKKLLVVSLPIAQYQKIMAQKSAPYVLEGKISSFSDNDFAYIRNSLVSSKLSYAQVDVLLYTNYLKYETPETTLTIYFFISGLIVMLSLLKLIPLTYRNLAAQKRLKKYSQGDIEMAYRQIEDDTSFQDVYKNKPIIITKRYIIVETMGLTFAMPLSELVWAYKGTTQNRVNGIPTSKTHSLTLAFSDKAVYTIPVSGKEEKVDDMLEYIFRHCDKTFVGYSKEMKKMFKKNFGQFMSEWQNHTNNNK